MKIDSTKLSSTQGPLQNQKTKTVSSEQALNKPQAAIVQNHQDTHTTISPAAQERAKATQLAQAAPDIRLDRVQELKKQIQQGTYKVDPDAIAEKLLAEEKDLSKAFFRNS